MSVMLLLIMVALTGVAVPGALAPGLVAAGISTLVSDLRCGSPEPRP